MNGMMPAIVSDIKVENAVNAFKYAGVKEDDIAIAENFRRCQRSNGSRKICCL